MRKTTKTPVDRTKEEATSARAVGNLLSIFLPSAAHHNLHAGAFGGSVYYHLQKSRSVDLKRMPNISQECFEELHESHHPIIQQHMSTCERTRGKIQTSGCPTKCTAIPRMLARRTKQRGFHSFTCTPQLRHAQRTCSSFSKCNMRAKRLSLWISPCCHPVMLSLTCKYEWSPEHVANPCTQTSRRHETE